MRGTNSIDTYDSLLFTSDSKHRIRNGFQHTVPLSTSFNLFHYFNMSPSLSYTERWYFQTTRYAWNNELNKVDTTYKHGFQTARDYQFSTGMSTRIYGMFQFKNGKIAAIRHVMTPGFSFNYRPDFGEAKYGYYKSVQTDSKGTLATYSIFQNGVFGSPSNGKFGSIGFNLDNNVEMKVRTKSDTGATMKKIKIFESLSLASSYNLIADSMKLSNISLNARTTLFEKIGLKFDCVLDPYAYDLKSRDYNKFLVNETGRLVHLTSISFNVDVSLVPRKKTEVPTNISRQELDEIYAHPENYVDFNIPYNLTVAYTFRYARQGYLNASRVQSVSGNGDVSITPQWKTGFNYTYDIKDGRFTNFGVNIYRDLHCWEMHMNWVPFGAQEGYNFQINVKSSILQDLKLVKKRDFFDN